MQAPTVPRADPKEQLNASGCGVTDLAAKKATAMGGMMLVRGQRLSHARWAA